MPKIIWLLAALIAAVLALAASRPNVFRVERKTRIKASPQAVFALVSDFRQWARWSPYDAMDPAMKRTYSGADQGVGAVYEWDGDRKVGRGRMEILEAAEPAKVVLKLDFITPFEGHNTAEFLISPQTGGAEGDGVEVTWLMYGPSAFVSKLMGLVFNIERMVGGQFEDGLARLKAAAEA